MAVFKKILFRCDSSRLIGTGHLIRCLSLAERLSSQGHEVLFACRNLLDNINQLIQQKNIKLCLLSAPKIHLSYPQPEQNWLEVPLEQEMTEFSEILNNEEPDWVIVDHYSIPERWEQLVRAKGNKLLVIDDIFRRHSCDALLDLNFHFDHQNLWKGKIPDQTQTFLGPKYALLASNFRGMTPKNSSIPAKAKNILAFFGGSDAAMISEKFLEASKYLAEENFEITLLLGGANKRQNSLEQTAFKIGVKCFAASSKVSELMSNSDLYIGAGGGTTWERCYFGVPAITVSVAFNQEQLSKSLAQFGAQIYLGHHEKISASDLAEAWKKIAYDKYARLKQRDIALSLQVSQGIGDLVKFFEQN